MGFVGWDSGLVSGRQVGCAALDSRFRGNDGGNCGRWDLLVGIRVWFPVARLVAPLWIPAKAGMTGGNCGKWDLLVGIRAWFPVARLVAPLWIPAFAGMDGENGRWDLLVGIRALFPVAKLVAPIWIPAFAGMTGGTWEMGFVGWDSGFVSGC